MRSLIGTIFGSAIGGDGLVATTTSGSDVVTLAVGKLDGIALNAVGAFANARNVRAISLAARRDRFASLRFCST